ncbi:MAG: HAD family hydrolase [Clostridia bacterium]|nr:HAD family hydrolase [Clostridia bacterium]
MKEYKVIIWDFNGTLIDDVNAALSSVNDMLKRRNLPEITMQQYASYVDTPIIKFYEHIFDDLYSMDFGEIALEFNAGYDKHLPQKAVMANAEEVLEYFNSKGKLQTVISATHIDKVTKRLEEFGLSGYFDKILAHNNLIAEDKTHLAVKYFAEKQIKPEEAVVIGDCVADYKMAQAIGADCILTTQGHQSRVEFAQTSAIIIDSLSALKNYIA